jgi:lipopolysaccharide/colanic/teichoic acid biosynthesis glycosyltransferase
VFKRTIDVSLSFALLMLSLPVLACAAIAIKLDSEGPVFFRQARMGRGFGCFRILKLRTMRVQNGGPTCTSAEDPRITRAGRWLRWLKVDELPQLWNVLRGDMSLVGPRPMVPELTLEFRQFYTPLLAVRPGLTDPATLKYCREDELLSHVADQADFYKAVLMPDKLALSAAYLERATVWTDFGVLARTAFALVPHTWMPRAFGNAPAAKRHIASERLFVEAAQAGDAEAAAENIGWS